LPFPSLRYATLRVKLGPRVIFPLAISTDFSYPLGFSSIVITFSKSSRKLFSSAAFLWRVDVSSSLIFFSGRILLHCRVPSILNQLLPSHHCTTCIARESFPSPCARLVRFYRSVSRFSNHLTKSSLLLAFSFFDLYDLIRLFLVFPSFPLQLMSILFDL